MELRNKSFPNEFQRAFYISKIYKGGLIQTRPRMIADNADRMAVNHIRKKTRRSVLSRSSEDPNVWLKHNYYDLRSPGIHYCVLHPGV